jgi:NAD(P)-dependent dehydrogenase (short-subunit alcohol dehydrogenase family)
VDLLEDFNVKYVGALRCSRAVIPFMKAAGWGRIIMQTIGSSACGALRRRTHD